MKKGLLLVLIFFFAYKASADCLACWTLTPVEVVLKTDKKIQGFVKWNDSWIDSLKGNFPNNFLAFHKKSAQPIEVYTQIKFYNHLFEATPFAPINSVVTINLLEIKDIKKRVDKLKDISGAGDINIVSQSQGKYFDGEPFSVFKEESTVSETIFLSYNQTIDKEKLIEVSRTEYYKRKDELEKEKVFYVTISWD